MHWSDCAAAQPQVQNPESNLGEWLGLAERAVAAQRQPLADDFAQLEKNMSIGKLNPTQPKPTAALGITENATEGMPVVFSCLLVFSMRLGQVAAGGTQRRIHSVNHSVCTILKV